ncbi:MAG TPA: M20/M25/M40 family metallo-hydrolase [Herpetosiphonaceae bacterium]
MESRTSDNQAGFVVPTGILTFVLLAALAFLGMYQMEPPRAASLDAAPTEFSAARALQHLEIIAQHPRPVGSAENTKAREYIAAELTKQGLQPEFQTATVTRTLRNGQESSATIENVMARLEGTGGGNNAVMIAGHYDSVQRGPGASDDMSAIAAMLETLRALRVGQAPANDVIFLFTDGEERGLLGAKAFVEEHPWADDVNVVMNFEARGTTGPSYMFETSDNNGWLISQFAKSPYPVGYSFTYDIYQLLPNDTDLTMFRQANMPGFGFAFIDGFVHYHMPTDSVANLNPRTLQHHGSYMLGLARQLANTSLDNTSAPNRTYFNILGFVVHYSQALNLPLMILTAILFVGVIVLGFRRGRLTIRGVIGGFFIFLLVLIASLLGVYALSFLLLLMNAQPINMLNGATYNWQYFTISYIALALAITSALYVWLRRRVLLNNLIVGAWLWWLIVLVATTFALPGTSYLFTWPLIFGLIALAVKFTARDEDAPRVTLLLVLLPAISGLLLLTPLIRGLFVALFLPLYVPVLFFVVLLFGLLLPHLMLMTSRSRWVLPIVSALVGLNLLIFAGLTAGAGV